MICPQNLKKCFVQVLSYWGQRLERNSVDLDEVAHNELPHLDLSS